MKQLFFSEKVYSRWVILFIDQCIITTALAITLVIVSKAHYGEIFDRHMLPYFFVYSVVSVIVFTMMRIHTGIIRYSNVEDFFRVFKAVFISGILFFAIVYVAKLPNWMLNGQWLITMLIIDFFISVSMLIVLRIGVKLIYHDLKTLQNTGKEVLLIFGADRSALLIKQGLDAYPENNFVIIGFIDNDPGKVNKYIEQKRVFPISDISIIKAKFGVDKMIVMEECLDIEGRKLAVEKCMELGIRVTSVPAPSHWLKGKLELNRLPDLKIEDLLQRDPICLEKASIISELCGKRILITGAAGSIGSEIVRQVLSCNPELVILCDQAETPLHEMQLEVREMYPDQHCHIFLSSVRNQGRLKDMFETFQPQIIFHAAALKHVPMMESHPSEAILTNVQGTKYLADLAIAYRTEKFIMISTDKAVCPTNVMGASKRLAELYIQSLHPIQDDVFQTTKFITTRFGNVLGSNGSVVPRFKVQIENGGPVTVTHPDVTRYFMTIPEAVQLVLEASVMGNGGEIFIFDMGNPIKILDLAIKMIKLSGLLPYQDIDIEFTGLRPGEKLYEELLNKTELVLPTYNEKIKISKVIHYPHQYVQNEIAELISLTDYGADCEIVKKMKQILPDYISMNSSFMELNVNASNQLN
ncbi:nucleoside-diphosphate sugar epimerase/dehydratase [Pedobacter sp. MC2016-24]|uniref:polysaccharide biosynthesis protein n=1 Tax=Pedobacter sp. MC2016-24 TaxID=2780090 RepID=UPI0018830758|nr:nucleoside-diphosphate sugar epimerase/dehydratase [Pedobacter sp. MC2016-24]MBE9601672.1 polysaccharide biosynthesis protein [Pedobacter sp. MC2016-24]